MLCTFPILYGCIDVFRNTGYGNLGYSEEYKFASKYNKKQLIAKQNNSFSTSSNTTNSYKETNMGFSTSLPKPSGMGSWQANESNINRVLSTLGVGSTANMNYGDMVIVEPLYDVRLQSTYHSITVTEIALYGKYILGSSSDGGTSSTPASWGFISSYTNKNYPNELYTPDGQGLWTGVSALSSRASFYNIINKGYGVGIAYKETTVSTYTIKFYGNGATGGSTASMTMTYNTAKNLNANGFSRTGHKYVKWNTKADGTGTSYSNKQSVKNLTTGGGTVNLYAIWTPNKLTVTYNANGGSLDSSSYYLSSGNIYANSTRKPASLIWTYNVAKANGLHNASTFGLYRTGYTFNQWQTSASGGAVFDQDNASLKPTDINSGIASGDVSTKLYARWKPNTYNIVFNGNGNTGGSTATMAMTYDAAKNLNANGFTKTGFHFSCWTTNKDGSGSVYYNQQSVKNLTSVNGATITLYTEYETNGENNALTLQCKVNHPLKLIPIAQNADYREGTDVITSSWLNNTYTDEYTPTHGITVKYNVYKGGNVIKTVSQTPVVVPGSEKNLLYFKWRVPTGLSGADVKITGEIIDGGVSYNKVTANYSTAPNTTSSTPDTQFEKKAPSGYAIPSAPVQSNGSAVWWEWIYSNGAFKKVNYGIAISPTPIALTPATGESAVKNGNVWTMKSGYALSLTLNNSLTGVSGYSTPTNSAYTFPQYATASFPEFGYSSASGKYRTLSLSSSLWTFPQNGSYGKAHFTPLWFPDGNYVVSVRQSDCWTPAGTSPRYFNSMMDSLKLLATEVIHYENPQSFIQYLH